MKSCTQLDCHLSVMVGLGDSRNPRIRSDWRIDDVKTVALHFAVDWRNMGGSHHVFGVSGIAEKVCVPAHKPIKPAYIRQFVALIDKVKELQA